MESTLNKETAEYVKRPVVTRVELPIKKVLSLEELRCNSHDVTRKDIELHKSDKSNIDEELTNIRIGHDDNEFYVFCACENCLDYREIVLELIMDELRTKCFYKIFQTTTMKFYLPIIKKAPPNVKEIFNTLESCDKFWWLSNGIVNKTKFHHIEFTADLPMTDNMIIVLFSTLLLVDDAHQLLELMSCQVECFARAYAEGITEMVLSAPESDLPAEDIITYVLDGYDELCKVAHKLSTFLFTFSKEHLEQFSLTWVLLNKRMYQRYVHTTFSATVPQCILKLKNDVSEERYAELVKRYIKFDDEMMSVSKKWREIWVSLNKYHMTKADQERRMRIKAINKIVEAIQNDFCVPFKEFIAVSDWETHPDRQLVWQNFVRYVNKSSCGSVDDVRLNATVHNEYCLKCESPKDFHKKTCKCVTCLIAGGPNLPSSSSDKQGLCFKCVFMEKVDKECPKIASLFLNTSVNGSPTNRSDQTEENPTYTDDTILPPSPEKNPTTKR